MYKTANDMIQVWRMALAPLPYEEVSEWAERNRKLTSATSATPGPWTNSKTPYLVEPMNCMSARSSVREVVTPKGSQLGFTEAGYNCVGYWIDKAPAPMMLTYPTISLAQIMSKTRVNQLLQHTPVLRHKVAEKKSRDSSNTIMQKEFSGGSMLINGANSAAGFRGYVFRFAIGDELSSWPVDCEGEGKPAALQSRGQATYGEAAKRWLFSTPGLEGECEVTALFQESDQRYFYVPCPFCGHMQIIKWENLKWEHRRPETVYLECLECNGHIKNHHKAEMLMGGEWRPHRPEMSDVRRGYHLSAMYSPPGWKSWEDGVRQFLEAQGDLTKLKVFTNQYRAIPWKPQGVDLRPRDLSKRRSGYFEGQIPDGVRVLTAGVDVQGMDGGYIAVEIVGWGENMHSWSINYVELQGDTADATQGAWELLTALLESEFQTASGPLPISMVCVDSGYLTGTVYDWVRIQEEHGQLVGRVTAIKGQSGWKRAPIAKGQSRIEGREYTEFWNVAVDICKEQLFDWLKNSDPSAYGYCNFPQDYSEKYFKRLTSERLVEKLTPQSKRLVRRFEIKDGRKRNEQLDCRVYAYSAALILGLPMWTSVHWSDGRLWSVERVGTMTAPPAEEEPSASMNLPEVRLPEVRL